MRNTGTATPSSRCLDSRGRDSAPSAVERRRWRRWSRSAPSRASRARLARRARQTNRGVGREEIQRPRPSARVDEGVEGADRDALHLLAAQQRDECPDRFLVEWRERRAGIVDPFGQGQTKMAQDQRLGQDEVEVLLVVAVLVTHRMHFAEARGGDQRSVRPLRSMSVLVASLVPWTTESIVPGAISPVARIVRTSVRTPFSGAEGAATTLRLVRSHDAQGRGW